MKPTGATQSKPIGGGTMGRRRWFLCCLPAMLAASLAGCPSNQGPNAGPPCDADGGCAPHRVCNDWNVCLYVPPNQCAPTCGPREQCVQWECQTNIRVNLVTQTCNGVKPLAGGEVIRVTPFSGEVDSQTFQTSVSITTTAATFSNIAVDLPIDVVAEVLDQNQNVISRGETGPILFTGTASDATIFLRPVASFDPANAATATGQCTFLETARIGHTMTVLGNGTVLIAGGYALTGSGQVWFSSTEIYDPQTGVISAGPEMTTARAFHTATHVPGTTTTVVVGGENAAPGSVNGAALSTAELYDEQAQTFTLLNTLPAACGGNGLTRHTAAVPLGNAIVSPPSLVIIQGGQDAEGNPTKCIDAYAPSNGILDTGLRSPALLTEAAAVPIPCGVLAIGGWGGAAAPFAPLKTVVGVVSPDCASFSAFPGPLDLETGLVFPVAARLADGSIVVVSGFSTNDVIGSSVAPQWIASTYASVTQLNGPTNLGASPIGTGLLDGTMLVAGGGLNVANVSTASNAGTLLFLHQGMVASRQLSSVMQAGRVQATAALLNDGTVLITGGYGFDASGNVAMVSSIDVFQPEYQISLSSGGTPHVPVE